MIKNTIVVAILLGLPMAARCDLPEPVKDVIKKVEATFEPAEARPGQSVTLKIKVEIDKGWRTYPTVQPDREMSTCVNKITFPAQADFRFKGEIKEPANPTVIALPELNVTKFHYYPGGGTWECQTVVSPEATLGKKVAKVSIRLLINTPDICTPPKRFDLEAPIKIAGEAIRENKSEVPLAKKP